MQTSSGEPHYSGKLRIRVCGVCQQDNQLLLVRHKPFALNQNGLWSLPGGGLQYGETLQMGLEREFREETGLQVAVGEFLFVHEFISLPLHALEMFFAVTIIGGVLTTGYDSELDPDNQLIAEVAFKSLAAIQKIPTNQLHQILQQLTSLNDLYSKNFSSSIR